MKELMKAETLDIVRQMITDGQVSQEVAEKYFPELKESEESEDERVKKAIKYGLDYVFTNNTTVYETTKEQCLAWLEKQVEQKPAEWSDEDYVMQRAALEILMASPKLVASTILKESVIVWFKSLKDRVGCEANCTTTWKPSEEQTVALDGICSYIRNKADWEISQDMISDLYKLSEQLKKLREE